ncbi:MAG: sensor domain-containing diguanylate cyclase [Thermodesulfobacteriota bacterium]
MNTIASTLPVFSAALKRSYVVETILALGIITVINLLWFRDTPGFAGVGAHPYFLVVLPIASRYGFRAGLFAAGMASAFYLGLLLPSRPDISPIDMRAFEYWGPPLLFAASGIVLGEIRESTDREYGILKSECEGLRADLAQLTAQYQALSQAKEAMDLAAITQEQTLSLLYESSQGLRTLTERDIYPAVLDLLFRYAGAEAASVYLLEDGTLRLKSSIGQPPGSPGNACSRPGAMPAGRGLPAMALDKGRAVSINACTFPDETPGCFLAAAPILAAAGVPLGVMTIEKIPFHMLTPQTLRVLSMLADWCAASVLNARTYLDTKNQLIADDVTKAYTYAFFQERVEEEFSRARRYKLKLSLLLFRIEDFAAIPESRRLEALALVSQIVRGLIRKIDLLFRHERQDQLILVLPCTPGEGAAVVARKFQEQLDAFHYEPVPGVKQQLRVTVSVVEASPEHASGKAMLEQAREQADAA